VVLALAVCLFQAPLAQSASQQRQAGGAVMVSGRVTDASGAPLRAALVEVRYGTQSIARFADASGAYRITGLPRAELRISASRNGYTQAEKTVTPAADIAADFQLKQQFDHLQLTSAEVMSLLPQNSEVLYLKTRCIACHGMTQLEHLRGVGAFEAWHGVMAAMQLAYDVPQMTDRDVEYAARLAMKYFGPDVAAPTEKTVQRTPISDAALNATFRMIELQPGRGKRALPHSVVADNKGGAWAVESGNDRLTHWDLASGTLKSVPAKQATPVLHTPTLDHQGRVWATAVFAKAMMVVDTKTFAASYVPLSAYPHTVSTDADGMIWGNGQNVYRIDPATNKTTYWTPPSVVPQPTSWGELGHTPGTQKREKVPLGPYHTVRDSRGIAWYTTLDVGGIVRLDPKTGEQKHIRPEGVDGSRGIDVDADDNIWYSNWTGYGLAKYDQKTGQSKLYKLPTKYGMPYSVFADRKRGYVWLADYAGNNLTRFDPRTEQFIEFPMPHNESYPRFLSIDDQGRIWFGEWWNGRLGVLDPGIS
jgi:virginiamycin B lyase